MGAFDVHQHLVDLQRFFCFALQWLFLFALTAAVGPFVAVDVLLASGSESAREKLFWELARVFVEQENPGLTLVLVKKIFRDFEARKRNVVSNDSALGYWLGCEDSFLTLSAVNREQIANVEQLGARRATHLDQVFAFSEVQRTHRQNRAELQTVDKGLRVNPVERFPNKNKLKL